MNLGKPLLEDLFNKQIRFRIPVFQRHYVWNEKDQLMPLWEDFINKFAERLKNQKYHPHYTGSIVLFQESTNTSTLSTYSIIDGQQRLTTFQLFIAAFREVCRQKINDENLIKELDGYLFNSKSFSDQDYDSQKFKLEPTKFNREVFKAIVSKTYAEVEEALIRPVLREYGVGTKTYRNVAKSRSRILGAYIFFYDQLNDFFSEDDSKLVEQITIALQIIKRDFQFVEIGLSKDDDPQMIFETMNGRGAALTQTDLIRNFIFMRVNSNHENLDSVYDMYWDEFDDPKSDFVWHAKISRGRYFESQLQFFIIDYLTLKLQNEIRYDQAFYYYKQFVMNVPVSMDIAEELKELKRYSIIFKRITNPAGEAPFDRLSRRLIDFGISTMYPLLLFTEGDEAIASEEKDRIYQYLDSYITRRFLCGMTIKNYNNVFLEYLKFFTKTKSAEAFKQHVMSKTGETNLWPADNMLRDKLIERPLYREEKARSRSISNIMLEIEQFLRGKKQEKIIFPNAGLTIEHVMPQSWFANWKLEGEYVSEEDFRLAIHAVNMEDDKNGKYHKIENRNKVLHTIGNLSILTGSLNPSVSNASFAIKKQELAKHSTLVLNTYFQALDEWDEVEIQQRSLVLFDAIRQIWSY